MDNGYVMALVLFLSFGVAIFKDQLLDLPNFSTLYFWPMAAWEPLWC